MNLSDQKLMFVKLVPKLESVRGKKQKTKQQKQKPTNNNARNYDKIYSPLSHCSCIKPPRFTLPSPPKKCIRIVFAIILHLHIDHNAPCIFPPPPPHKKKKIK